MQRFDENGNGEFTTIVEEEEARTLDSTPVV
jgi:hypothetical protein